MYSDLRTIKSVLEIDPRNTIEDKKLLMFLDIATNLIEDVTNRPGMLYRVRTEYYNGTGTRTLLLRHRPVYTTPTPLIYVDQGGYFGSVDGSFDTATDARVYGTDFCLDLTEEGEPSRSGIVYSMKGAWPPLTSRLPGLLTPVVQRGVGNIKVVYGGGYTADDLPSAFRFACTLLVTRLRYLMPLGFELTGENYEDRSITLSAERKDWLLAGVKPLLFAYRNWRFGG